MKILKLWVAKHLGTFLGVKDYNPVSKRCCFNLVTTLSTSKQRCINVKTTLCAYWEIDNVNTNGN